MNQDHVFLDFSVTDRKITAVAAVRTDRKGKEIRATYSAEVMHECGNSDISQVIDRMKDKILDPKYGTTYVVISHFAEVDRRMLKENGVSELFIGRAWLDTSQIAWPFVYHDLAGERSLASLCAYFGVENPDCETATGNCEAVLRLYWAMMNRYKLALLGDEAIREYGGETLKSVFSFLGL